MIGVSGDTRIHPVPIFRPLVLDATQRVLPMRQLARVAAFHLNCALARDVGKLATQTAGCRDTATGDNLDHLPDWSEVHWPIIPTAPPDELLPLR